MKILPSTSTEFSRMTSSRTRFVTGQTASIEETSWPRYSNTCQDISTWSIVVLSLIRRFWGGWIGQRHCTAIPCFALLIQVRHRRVVHFARFVCWKRSYGEITGLGGVGYNILYGLVPLESGIGGALLFLLDFFFLSSVDVSVSIASRMASLSPLSELVALLFLRGGRAGGGIDLWDTDFCAMLDPSLFVTELLAILIQLTPFRFLGRRGFSLDPLPMWAIRLWYRVAAITMASSGDWQTNAWHSSCLGTDAERITTAKMGAWRLDERRLLSEALSGRNRELLSIFSGSVIRGKKAAPPSEADTTNFTADQTAILWNGVKRGSRPLVNLTRRPLALISKFPAFWFWNLKLI